MLKSGLLAAAVLGLLLVVACNSTESGPPDGTPPGVTVTPVPTADSPVYRNGKYGYQVPVPAGYRVASIFMERFAQETSDPTLLRSPEDYVLLTTLPTEEERQAVEEASTTPAIGLEPWLRFQQGVAIHILPTHLTEEAFLRNSQEGGLIVVNSEVREETLDSGRRAVRLTRREISDNGDITYDAVYIPMATGECPPFGGCQGFVVRIVKTPDYARQAFEVVFRGFRESR
ncbi:hypothetical protein HRbin25_00264 [bacterium HR25]|jgi:hypothetical protein|nr:hypothetical protein HRbin25_00264 [bacterium HR25]